MLGKKVGSQLKFEPLTLFLNGSFVDRHIALIILCDRECVAGDRPATILIAYQEGCFNITS